jgi:hypothetical protein
MYKFWKIDELNIVQLRKELSTPICEFPKWRGVDVSNPLFIEYDVCVWLNYNLLLAKFFWAELNYNYLSPKVSIFYSLYAIFS